MAATDIGAKWPAKDASMDHEACRELVGRLRPCLLDKLREERLPPELFDTLSRVYVPLAAWTLRQKGYGRPLILGINGAQGSGKSTLCRFLKIILQEGFGCRTAVFSIDDIYKTQAERLRLGREVHPLLATRGVPGTHDVELGSSILRALISPAGGRVAIPAFDKATDDRRPEAEWPIFEGPADIVLFEGWCVGARPQREAELAEPVNDLERREDAAGIWRCYVNRQLEGAYAGLFGMTNRLIMLRAPDMHSVMKWRRLQEQKLAEEAAAGNRPGKIMDPAQLERFVMHFERLTRHMLAEMPERADLTLFLNPNHQFTSIHIKH